jgi:hypothetical protein
MSATYCSACYARKVYCRGCKGYHCQCSWTGRYCRTWFRKHLNAQFEREKKHKNYQFEQRTRPYGDYLCYQDREKFEMEFNEFQARGRS